MTQLNNHSINYKNKNMTKLNNHNIDFWAYLAGLLEADGCYTARKRSNNKSLALFIAGHLGQRNHLYNIALKVGKPFSLGVHSNYVRIVWTNPLAINYISSRLAALFIFGQSNTKLFCPLLPKLERQITQVFNSNSSTDELFSKPDKTRTPYKNYLTAKGFTSSTSSMIDNILLSIIIGFLDGDGDMNVLIMPQAL